MDDWSGALRILALVTHKDKLIQKAKKSLVLFGAILSEDHFSFEMDPAADDIVQESTMNKKQKTSS